MFEIALSYTAQSEKKVIYRTRCRLKAFILYWILNKYYEKKMFVWKRKQNEKVHD